MQQFQGLLVPLFNSITSSTMALVQTASPPAVLKLPLARSPKRKYVSYVHSEIGKYNTTSNRPVAPTQFHNTLLSIFPAPLIFFFTFSELRHIPIAPSMNRVFSLRMNANGFVERPVYHCILLSTWMTPYRI